MENSRCTVPENAEASFLECERWWIFVILMTAAGWLGAFTYTLRGNVFCNAQTGNFVLLAMALGNAQWGRAGYLLIPISSYFIGTVISEILPNLVKKTKVLRWDTILIGIEIIVIVILGFLPESAPYQISQVAINFICSMQYNTFRQAQGIPMATTFCTNHVRQTSVHLVKWIKNKNPESLMRFSRHALMIAAFVFGGVVSACMCSLFLGKAVWGAAIVLFIGFADLLYADLKTEKGQLYRKPRGH